VPSPDRLVSRAIVRRSSAPAIEKETISGWRIPPRGVLARSDKVALVLSETVLVLNTRIPNPGYDPTRPHKRHGASRPVSSTLAAQRKPSGAIHLSGTAQAVRCHPP
jgi:hypothetical protein